MRVGMGYDVHKLVEGRKLILGGVEIPHTLGLLGHSDADVLLHAIMDALLGAAALGDIGKHFPDTDERYRGISQKPKLRPFIEEMEGKIADTLGIEKTQVNVKATTEEHLGFTGREEGIASQAVCLISTIYENSVTVGDSQTGCAGCFGCGSAGEEEVS